MKNALLRIAIWTSAGFLVSAAWGFYFASANKEIPIGPSVYLLANITQPILSVVVYLYPTSLVGLTSVVVANAATYALLGLIVETIKHHRSPNISHRPTIG